MPTAYESFVENIRELGTARAIEALLDWDQETYMPPRAAEDRANQLAFMAGLIHERLTSDTLGGLLDSLERDGQAADEAQQTNVRETRRDFDRAVKLPRRLVEEIARATSLARNVWIKARADSDFPAFAPHLERLLDLKRQAADAVGWTTERYDALMDEFEPGAKSAEIEQVFKALRAELVPLAAAIAKAPRQPDLSILERECPVEAQAAFNRRMAEALCFDFQAGRIDISAHPFCTHLSPLDVRMTTRYDAKYMPGSLFGVLHETGHALYEQGQDVQHALTPRGSAVSLGIHESQSRMWENLVGRSREFWEHFYPALQAAFPSMARVPLDAWVFAINAVRPSLIRVEADEVTYGLHIMLRFELERGLIAGKLATKDVPAAWNDGMRQLVGITPGSDALGCLQDIHWASGIFGYFPTYQLGNLYAAQFYEAAQRALPDLRDRIRKGELRPLREWLRENIHRHGRRYPASELVRHVTGRPLSAEPFLKYLRSKFAPLYGLPM